jgi:hypothetical protein
MPAATLESTSTCLLSMNSDELNEDEVDDTHNNIVTPMDAQMVLVEHVYTPPEEDANKRKKLSAGEVILPKPVEISKYRENMDAFTIDKANCYRPEKSLYCDETLPPLLEWRAIGLPFSSILL